VTSAGANGTSITNIGFTLDKKTKTFAGVSGQNVIVENGVRLPDGSCAKDAGGNFIRNPDLVDAEAKNILDKDRTAVAPIANRVIGSITSDITRTPTPAGESSLGDVFSVQPFNDLVVTQTFTGAQIATVLEQQFAGFLGQTSTRILQVSAGFSYSYDTSKAAGSRISNLALRGVPLDPAATFRVTTPSFLANGGDGFTTLATGTERSVAPGFDIDALIAYFGQFSISPSPTNRITSVF
jgi:5'-nucleotidase